MDPNTNKFLIIGHRGVGKSSIIKDLKASQKSYLCYDLDEQVELRRKVKIQELFRDGKIKEFRKLEHEILNEIISQFEQDTSSKEKNRIKFKKLFVALGAGFEIEKLNKPDDSSILWVRRKTDEAGRIFFDRPSLTGNLNPLKEWAEIFYKRQKKYSDFSTAQFYIPENLESVLEFFLKFLEPRKIKTGYVTYIPNENDFIIHSGRHNIELRTDLVPFDKILNILGSKLNNNFNITYILAIRGRDQVAKLLKALKTKLNNRSTKLLVDWDMSLDYPPSAIGKIIDIYSSHSQTPVADVLNFQHHLTEKFKSKNKKKVHYKLCPKVASHEAAVELDLELEDLLVDFSYSFLPRSEVGFNLSYFRQLKSYRQKIGFYRFGDGSSSDQPLWFEWPDRKPKGFYGIYGNNISHSLTPAYHFKFFKSKSLWPISIDGFDRFFDYVPYFKNLDLKTLAVTSPYKKTAYLNTVFKDKAKLKKEVDFNLSSGSRGTLGLKNPSHLKDFKSANTVVLNIETESFNTDYMGLCLFLKRSLTKNLPILVWGGGSLLEQLKDLHPQAFFYSARTGKPRDSSSEIKTTAGTDIQIIWASGERGLDPCVLQNKINIKKIIDLDYRKNSKARLYSFLNSIDYTSGYNFFTEQALLQQKVWDTYEF